MCPPGALNTHLRLKSIGDMRPRRNTVSEKLTGNIVAGRHVAAHLIESPLSFPPHDEIVMVIEIELDHALSKLHNRCPVAAHDTHIQQGSIGVSGHEVL